jgi:AcrR family transcriptional regulator
MALDRKDQILAAAYEIVGTQGLEELHARSVAAKVGINHAAVHYYFPKRTDLIVGVASYAVGRFDSDREKLLADASNVTARIDAMLAQAEAYCKPNSRFVKNWLSFFVAGLADESVHDVLSNHLVDWAEGFSAEIQQGSKTGAVRRASPFVNPELLVATLLGIMVAAHTIGPDFDVEEKLDLVAGSLLA